MQDWIAEGKEPPASEIPLIRLGELVLPSKLAFPAIPGISVPQHKREAYRLNFSVEPPEAGPAYPSLVPQVNQDGNETTGIQMPEVAVPLGTYTGWNLRSASIGSADEMFSMVGSFIPFAKTKNERMSKHDPRLSVEERYATEEIYLTRITTASQQLVQHGLLLEGDVPSLRERASQEWDYVMTASGN